MMNTARPHAYIRRSVTSRTDPGDLSREFQTETVRSLAGPDATQLVIVDGDWGRSAATDKTDLRLAFLALMADIERGAVSVLYAYSTDRLARSVEWTARLLNACRRAEVPIVTREGRINPGDAGAALLFQVLAAVNENALSGMEAKAAAALEARRARGDVLGQAGFGRVLVKRPEENGRVVEIPGPDHDRALKVVEAYKLTGSIMRTSKYLQDHGIPAPRGGKKWGTHTVSNILTREASELFPRRGKPSKGSPTGRRTPTTVWYAQLVHHHCGATMSPNRPRHQLICPWGHREGGATHGRTTISANAIEEYVNAELDHFQLPGDTYELAKDDEARRGAIVARLERYRELYLEGGEHGIDKRRWDAEKARYDADLAALDDRQTVVQLPPRDELWSYADRDISKLLRSIFLRIDLSADMVPSAVWRNPALRQRCDDPACTHCPRRAKL